MTQFASTLYPQTNPSNSFLLTFRDDCSEYPSVSEAADSWLLHWRDMSLWVQKFQHATPDSVDHARRVLTRLVALSG